MSNKEHHLTMPFGYYEGRPMDQVPVEHLKDCIENDSFEIYPEHLYWTKERLTAHSSQLTAPKSTH